MRSELYLQGSRIDVIVCSGFDTWKLQMNFTWHCVHSDLHGNVLHAVKVT